MDNEVTREQLDKLCRSISTNWKRFALVGTLSQHDIDAIDMDERTVYEKCYKMMKKWQNQSLKPVTVALVKEKLRILQLNTTIRDVFGSDEDIAELKSAVQKSVANDNEEITNMHQVELSSRILGHWKQFAYIIPMSEHVIEGIDLDNRTTSEKCYQLFKTWRCLSSKPITVSMVKEKLRTLSFNRIIDEVFESGNAADVFSPDSQHLLCTHLSTSWKNFSKYIPLPSYMVDVIDLEERSYYDKTQRLLNAWKQAEGGLTNTMVKNVLKTLQRNDIILLLFEKVDAVPANTLCQRQELKIADLNERHVEEISSMLGESWKSVGCRLLKGNKSALTEISGFEKVWAREPSKMFLIRLIQKYPKKTVQDLIDACNAVERKDVVLFINNNNIPKAQIIHELSYNVDLFDRLALSINGFITTVAGWRIIAGVFNFSCRECDEIASSMTPASESPARMLLKFIMRINPLLTLSSFASVCKEFNKTDVHNKVHEIIKDLNKTSAKVEIKDQNLNDQLQNMSLNEDLPKNQMRCFHWLRALGNLHPDMCVPDLKEYASSEETKEKLATFSDLEPLVEYSEEELKSVVRVIVDEWEDIGKLCL